MESSNVIVGEETEEVMVEWSNGVAESDEVTVPDSVPDFVSLYPELEWDGCSEDEMEDVRESTAPYNPSHPRHRDYCSGCSSCDREP